MTILKAVSTAKNAAIVQIMRPLEIRIYKSSHGQRLVADQNKADEQQKKNRTSNVDRLCQELSPYIHTPLFHNAVGEHYGTSENNARQRYAL